jgi:hypothetical protein
MYGYNLPIMKALKEAMVCAKEYEQDGTVCMDVYIYLYMYIYIYIFIFNFL